MDSKDEPIHVTFARECLGWKELRECDHKLRDVDDSFYPHCNGWIGRPSNGILTSKHVLRVDLPGYDLMPWVQANNLFIQPIHVMNPDHTQTWEVSDKEDEFYRQADELQIAVLLCLIALARAGKLVRP